VYDITLPGLLEPLREIYVIGWHCDIKRMLQNMLDVHFTNPKKLDTIIRKGKDRLDAQVTEIVYKINCKDCDKVYTGQTKRHLATRIKEHKSNTKLFW